MTSRKRMDLSGQRFGRLTVTGLVKINEFRDSIWACKCECGKEVEVSLGSLRSGHTQSCGCLRVERQREAGKKNTIGYGKAAANSVLYGYKKGARIRKLKWELTDEEFFNLTKKNCYYCGEPPSLLNKRSCSYNGGFISNGIDRKDNSLGYTIGNCVPCCKQCNYAKRVMSFNDFKSWILKVYQNLYL